MNILKISALVFFFVTIMSDRLEAQDYDTLYNEGTVLIKDGNWPAAMNKWLERIDEVPQGGQSDPRIGIALIELITEKGLRHLYSNVSDAYMWGFSNVDIEKHKELILLEAERIYPLLKNDDLKQWKNDAKKDLLSLSTKIKGFWLEKDPSPITPANERLLEHWERIHYARKNFTRNKNSVYKTDDRGILYIKYGEPDSKHSGTLGDNDKELAFWAADINLRRELNLRYNTFPEYEVWLYYHDTDIEPAIYLFGAARQRPFGLYDGVEDFISSRAFSRSNEFGEAYVPGSYFQLMFYDRLASIDRRYSDRYYEISSYMNSGDRRNANLLRGIRNRFQAENKDDPIKKSAPEDASKYKDIIKPMNMKAFPFRVLEDNKPKLNIIMMSYPSYQHEYILQHSIMIRDEKFNLVNNELETIEPEGEKFTFFKLDHKKEAVNITVAAQATVTEKDTINLSANNPSAATQIFKGYPQLSTDQSQLEVSDMLYGTDLPAGVTLSGFDVELLPTDQISDGDPLKVYIEVYNVLLGSDGEGNIEVTFQVEKTGKKGILEKLIGRSKPKGVLSQRVPYSVTERNSKLITAFNTEELTPGEYEFMLEVRDTRSGNIKYRIAEFKIIN